MEKIKNRIKKSSIKMSYAISIVLCLFFALSLSVLSSGLCQLGSEKIRETYKDTLFEGMEIKEDEYQPLENIESEAKLWVASGDVTEGFSDGDRVRYKLFDFLSWALTPVWFIGSITITSILFYRRQLRKPLEILSGAAEKISENNLDFTIFYEKDNEFGKLCRSFEKMRESLQETHVELWRHVEERKRLNAAFAHDLRTPLTVLKGQSEMMLRYIPEGTFSEEKILSSVATMNAHIHRLERYVEVMNHLQKLEDIQIEKTVVFREELLSYLKQTGQVIAKEKLFHLDTTKLKDQDWSLDFSVVMQVYENLMANAVRFAQANVIVEISDSCGFQIAINDDGCGFSEKELTEAVKPFYKAGETTKTEHFGMGLYICSVLCKKHGGSLKIDNNQQGAAVYAKF